MIIKMSKMHILKKACWESQIVASLWFLAKGCVTHYVRQGQPRVAIIIPYTYVFLVFTSIFLTEFWTPFFFSTVLCFCIIFTFFFKSIKWERPGVNTSTRTYQQIDHCIYGKLSKINRAFVSRFFLTRSCKAKFDQNPTKIAPFPSIRALLVPSYFGILDWLGHSWQKHIH